MAVRTIGGRSRGLLGALAAAAVLLAGCAPMGPTTGTEFGERSVDARTPGRGGSAQVALASEPDLLDPTQSSTLVARQVFASMCEKLYDYDESMTIVPQLATELPQTSPDGRQLTVSVRRDARFADGTPLDAAAVKKSLDRHLQLESSSRTAELASVEEVTVRDPGTVVLSLSQPDASLPSVLADRAGMIMSPQALDRLGEDFGTEPVCVGPFAFVSRAIGDRIVLRRDPNYYAADEIALDEVIYRVMTDSSVRLANLRSRDVVVGDQMAPVDVLSTSGDGELQLFRSPSFGYYGLTVNTRTSGGPAPGAVVDTPLATRPELRTAFALSLDRALINKIAFQDMYAPACGPVPPASAYADPDLVCPGRDLERARRLVAESGLPTPVPVELSIPNTANDLRTGQIIQAMANEAGFDVRLRAMEFTSLLEAGKNGDFEMLLSGWSGRVDPNGNMASFLRSGAPNNYGGYANDEVDAQLAEALTISDVGKRRAAYRALQEKLAEDLPIIYLFRPSSLVLASNRLAGLRVYADGLIRLRDAGYAT